jgi:hypothetical protein
MAETLYETAARAHFCAVGSSDYKERADSVEEQLVGHCLELWAKFTRGLPLKPVGFDQAARIVLGFNAKVLSNTLAAHLRSKALQFERQIGQAEASPNASGSPQANALATYRKVAGSLLPHATDRGHQLTLEIFPSICLFATEKLVWDIEEIVEGHGDAIRQAVLEVLEGLRSSTQTQASSELIFDAVAEMSTELFYAALFRTEWIDEYNPPESYDEVVDALYVDGLDFVKQKYESVVSEIPGLSPTCEPAMLDSLRMEWLRIREEAKRDVHESSIRSREIEKLVAARRAREPHDLGAVAVAQVWAENLPKPGDTKQQPDKSRKGDATLLGEKRLVNFAIAELYLGIGERQRQKLIGEGTLRVEGQGTNRKVTVESLKAYLPPEIPN